MREVGAGDIVARMTRALGIEPCDACQKRKAVLNRYVQFVPRQPPAKR